MVRNVDGELVTDVSGQSIGAIIKSQLDGLNSDVTAGYPDMSVITNRRCVKYHKGDDLIYTTTEA
jgi:hypothetical protein